MISVCMATYNGEKYLKNQLDSILSLLKEEDEVIVSDDGSLDKTINILNSYTDKRIKVFKNTDKKGVIGNFENAINKSSGDYIFLSDQDDVWVKGKVKRIIQELHKADLVISDAFIIDKNNVKQSKSFFELNKTKPGFINNIINGGYLGCAMAFKKEIKEYVLPFPKKIAMHDLWIGSLVSLKGDVAFIDDKLILYRRHDNNVSYSGEKSQIPFLNRIFYRLRLLVLVSLRFLESE